MQALIWAFKPTDIVDIRRFPREEAIATDKEIARLRGEPSTMRTAVAESTEQAEVDRLARREGKPAPAADDGPP